MTMHVFSLIEMVWINDIEANQREENLNKRDLFNISNIYPRQKLGCLKIEWNLLLESPAFQTCLLRQKL